MKPENKKFLDDNRHHHTTLVKAQYLKHLNGAERDGMQRVMSEEFQPGYATDLWCPPCVSDMVLLLYRKYDEWLAKEECAKQTTAPIEGAIIVPEASVEVAATFPSHFIEEAGEISKEAFDSLQIKPKEQTVQVITIPAPQIQKQKNYRRR